MKRIDLSGKKIGKITVLNFSHSHIQPSKQKRAMWDVECECGVTKKMSTSTLSNPKLLSCGCEFNKRREEGFNKKEKGEANFNYIFLSYKARARNKKIDFELDKESFRNIIIQKCVYCHQFGKNYRIKRSCNGTFVSNGIDRIDSSKGYTKDNIVPCCKRCNQMKNNLSLKDFLNHIKNIYYVSVEKGLQPEDHF
jgi:hypothetical protein